MKILNNHKVLNKFWISFNQINSIYNFIRISEKLIDEVLIY
jgi:hypothetical protein